MDPMENHEARPMESPQCIRANFDKSEETTPTGEQSKSLMQATNSPFIVRQPDGSSTASPLVMPVSPPSEPTKATSKKHVPLWLQGIATSETRVDLSRHNLTDVDADDIVTAMIQTKTIKHLILAKNSFGNMTAIAIAKALTRNHTLESLSLAGNEIGEEGGLAFAEALAYNGTLRSLYLSNNPLGETATRALIEANEGREEPMHGLNGLVLGVGER